MDWTSAEHKILKEVIQQDLKPSKVKEQYFPYRSTESIRSQIKRVKQNPQTLLPDVSTEELRLLKRQNESLLRSLQQERAKTQLVVEALEESIAKKQVKLVKPPKKETTHKRLEFHALRSDEQVGQKTDPTRTQFIATYNTDIYKERSNLWCEKVCAFREEDKNSHGLNKLVINWLGDHVEGESIYPGPEA